MTLFSLLEDEVEPGVANTPQEYPDIHRGNNQFSNQTGFDYFPPAEFTKEAGNVFSHAN